MFLSAFSDFQIFREVNVEFRTEVEQTCCLNIIMVWTIPGFHRSTIGSPKGGRWFLDAQ